MNAEQLIELNRPGELSREGDKEGSVQCLACAHNCMIPPGKHGRCYLRVNRGGCLRVPFGYVSALNIDPVEKKPFYHFLPGQTALSFGMLGCNFQCPFCQNWTISQCLRDPEALTRIERCEPKAMVNAALNQGARIVCSTYNEPLITSEWAVAIFKRAKAKGLRTAYVSNGFASPAVIDYLDPWLDAMNVDLKCFREANYAALGGRLQPVLDTIRRLRKMGKWVEVITLVVPGFNDSDEELADIARFVAETDPAIPWHVSAYHANYKYRSREACTPAATIARAVSIGREAGLNFVYSGNLRGPAELGDTRCPSCGRTLIERHGFCSGRSGLQDGACPDCRTQIPGVWN